jgi:hypothetical protein
MGNNKITGLAPGTSGTDAANLSQVQSSAAKLLQSVTGTDTITAAMVPALTSYSAGQMFYFVAAGDNTGAVTINIDSLGAKAVTRDGSVALAAGDIKSGEVVVVVYDGTRFQVVSQLNSAGNATFANVSITSALNVGGVATFSAGTAAAPSITTNGDTNTGIFFPAADTIAFTEGGVESMRIDSSGNVGISEGNAPTQVLSLYRSGSTNAIMSAGNSNTGLDGTWFGVDTAGNGIVNVRGAFPLLFSTSALERMRLDSSGNLGIGTSSPGARLHSKSSAAENTRLEGTTARGSGDVFMSFYDPTGRKGYLGYGSASDDGYYIINEMNAPMIFYTNNTERARITADGNIVAGASAALATTATNGFLYVPTCAGTPTGTPTAITGMAPIVVNTTNNKLYFYSGGSWRDAGP